ncbi:MAG: T9SS type A sorting domain-containing protein [Saprospiraceae bacterium]|nr:T9SS type A sorting domain-containing protein [Saprospiraceae bacterium]
MTNFTPYILRISFLFLFFSLAAYSFGQNGRGGSNLPDVNRTEDDGGGSHSDCITLNGSDYTLEFTVTINYTNQTQVCPIVFGYTIPGSDIQYLNPIYGQAYANGDVVYNFELTITPADAAAMCAARLKDEDPTTFEYNFYCANNGDYELYDPFIPNGIFGVNLCCSDEDLTSSGNDDNLNNRLNSGTITDVFTLDIHSIEEDQITNQQAITYYLYDMYGNQVDKFQNNSTGTSIQNIIARLSIRSGVYFVRYLDGTQIRTQKVFKH